MSPPAPPLSKADRLAIGGAVAPAVRRQAGAPRVVTVVGKDGQPVRQTTAVEVAKSVLARADVEFSVQEGKRPKWMCCEDCAKVSQVPPRGRVFTRCAECRSATVASFVVTPGQYAVMDRLADEASAELSARLGSPVRVGHTYVIRQMLSERTVLLAHDAGEQLAQIAKMNHEAPSDTAARLLREAASRK